jgi:leucyl aminopeptidase (aminopeptidase T)
MRYILGTEPLRQYLSFELAGAARKLVEDVMLTKPKEQVIITADTSNDTRVVEATAKAVYSAGATPIVLWYETQLGTGVEPPRPVSAAIVESDVWIEFATGYTLYSNAYERAVDRGVRYICLSGMDVEMMVRTLGRVDYKKLVALGETLRNLVAKAKKIRVISSNSAELVAYNGGRFVRHSGKLADTRGDSIMLGGQISWCPLEESINGEVVFDGMISPPSELGPLQSPVTISVKAGIITRIDGGKEAQVFSQWLAAFNDPNMYRIAHYSLGFNPGVNRPTGRIVEDECVFGCIDFGIGTQGAIMKAAGWKASSHADGTVLQPTIHLDDEVIEMEGIYVHPDVRAACRDLGVRGY